jgi:hypothetical protein
MDTETLLREWSVITGFLPPDWRELARSTGAFTRGREIRDPDTLLLLLMLHIGTGLSMRQTAARAERAGLAQITDVSLLDRMRKSGPWLRILAQRLFAESPHREALREASESRQLRVVDATTIREPGSTGTDWRVHYSLKLPSLECDFFEVTDPSGGETYTRLRVKSGDVILGDRGYSHRRGVAHVVDAGGDVVMRLNTGAFPLLDARGQAFDLLGSLRTLPEHGPGEWPVFFTASGRRYAARVVAIRKSKAAAKQSREKLLAIARKKQKQVRPETLEAAGYIVVLTTLGPENSAADVLELYRFRWQVELAFKRMKSLLGAGHVPKKNQDSARAWIHGKLLAVLLIEKLGQAARLFSPWGYRVPAGEPLAGVHRGQRQPARRGVPALPAERAAEAGQTARGEAEGAIPETRVAAMSYSRSDLGLS